MFFVGIFGVDQKEKEIKSFNVVCPDCGGMTQAVLYMSYTYFHMFFIPTFRWNKHYYVKLRCCGSVYDVPEDYALKLKEWDTLDFSRLKKTRGSNAWNSFYTTCPVCGKSFERGFPYCPYCGAKQ